MKEDRKVETKSEEYLDQLLDLYRVQRHDFLNHFQVAMGYIQLGKGQAALDYLRQASATVMDMAPLSRFKPAELSVELLQLARWCVNHDVDFNFELPEAPGVSEWRVSNTQVMGLVRYLAVSASQLMLKIFSKKGASYIEIGLTGVNPEQLAKTRADLLKLGVSVEELGSDECGQTINLLVGL